MWNYVTMWKESCFLTADGITALKQSQRLLNSVTTHPYAVWGRLNGPHRALNIHMTKLAAHAPYLSTPPPKRLDRPIYS